MDIKVEGKSKKVAELLKQDYSSRFSDLTAFLLYKYQTYLFFESDKYFSSNMNKFSKDSLSHLEILGRIITLLGGTPDHTNFEIDSIYYEYDKEKLIEVDIRITKERIISYTKHLNQIEDIYIKKILTNFIVEERKNLEILEIMQLKYKKERNK